MSDTTLSKLFHPSVMLKFKTIGSAIPKKKKNAQSKVITGTYIPEVAGSTCLS